MKPALIALDLDGTVMPYSTGADEPSARVRRAVAAVRSAGIPVAIATGRAVWGALHGLRALGVPAGAPLSAVCSNGGAVYDVGTDTVTHTEPIDPGPAVRALLGVDPSLGIAVEHGLDGYWYNGAFELNFESRFAGLVDVPTLVSEPTVRLVCRLPGDDADVTEHPRRRTAAHRLVQAGGLVGLGYQVEVGFSGWIDVTAAGVSKASGTARVAAELGVPAADVLAVGDGTNDLPLFDWAGYSVAMGQAPAAVRRAADEVTATVDDDGVALVLERWL